MAAKLVQVSADNSTYYTLPGSTADMNREGSGADDTIFGASYSSSQPTLVTWSMSANAYYKGFAGYNSDFYKTGTATAMTDEACTLLSGKTYQITSTAKQILDRTTALVVKDGGVDQTAEVESVDHLFGKVTFVSTYTVTGAVTVSGNYLPTASVGSAREFSLTMTAEEVPTTDFATAQANGGFSTGEPGLKTVSVDASGFYRLTNGFAALVDGRTEMVISIDPKGDGKSVARGFFKAITTGQSGDVGGNEDESVTFELSVPQADTDVTKDVVTPFAWHHAVDTTLADSMQVVLNAWESGDTIYVRYLSDGVAGAYGECVITDTSMSSAVDGIVEFSLSLSGSGSLTAV